MLNPPVLGYPPSVEALPINCIESARFLTPVNVDTEIVNFKMITLTNLMER